MHLYVGLKLMDLTLELFGASHFWWCPCPLCITEGWSLEVVHLNSCGTWLLFVFSQWQHWRLEGGWGGDKGEPRGFLFLSLGQCLWQLCLPLAADSVIPDSDGWPFCLGSTDVSSPAVVAALCWCWSLDCLTVSSLAFVSCVISPLHIISSVLNS